MRDGYSGIPSRQLAPREAQHCILRWGNEFGGMSIYSTAAAIIYPQSLTVTTVTDGGWILDPEKELDSHPSPEFRPQSFFGNKCR